MRIPGHYLTLTGLLAFSVAAPLSVCSSAHPNGDGKKTDTKEQVARLLHDIVKVEDFQRIDVNNSRVLVVTPAVQRTVKIGRPILPVLILAMKDEKISFDAFARCYSACDQILLKYDRKLAVAWDGGCEVRSIRGCKRIYPGGQSNEAAFRKSVVKDVEAKAALTGDKEI